MRNANLGPLVTLKMQGGGKVDTTKRALLGLLGRQQPSQSQPLAVVTPQPVQQTVSPLQAVAEKVMQAPMTRREFMEKTGKTIGSQAVQDMTGGLGLGSIAKVAAKSALPTKTEAEIADTIADYATKILDNEEAVAKAFAIATGKSAKDYWDFGDGDFPILDVFQEIAFAGKPEAMGAAAKAVGLDIEGISRATGLSIKDVTKIVKDDSELLGKLSDTSGSKNYMYGVLEDGRPKEAYRSTSLSDIDEEEVNDIIDSVIKEYGKDADDIDLVGEVSDRIRSRFFEKERGHGGDDPLYGALYKRVLDDDTLDEVYGRMTEDDYMGLSDRIYDRLSGD